MKKLELEKLAWDSSFFERAVFAAQVEDSRTFQSALKEQPTSSLLYLFSPVEIADGDELLVDVKRTYDLDPQSFSRLPELGCDQYEDKKPNDDLLKLAYLAGRFSRFLVDPKISSNKAKDLYKTWIENSLTGEAADAVYVKRIEGKIAGMVTVQKKDETVWIRLISVFNKFQGRGVGRELFYQALVYARAQGSKSLKVQTQRENVQACCFYENCGFTLINEQFIYHRHKGSAQS